MAINGNGQGFDGEGMIMETRPEVIVTGAGVIGGMVTYFLTKAGYKVLCLERENICSGSSSRSAACSRQQFDTVHNILATRFSTAFYERFPQEIGANPVLKQNGYLFLYKSEDSFGRAKEAVVLQRQYGLAEVECLDSPETIKRFPRVNGDGLLGSTWCPTDGFIAATNVVHDTLVRAEQLGAKVVKSAPVTKVRRNSDKIEEVVTPKGNFSANLFVNCAGPWSSRVARIFDAEIPVAPLKRYLYILSRGESAEVADGMSDEEFMDLPMHVMESGAYCRPESPRQLLMGWAHETKPDDAFESEDQDRIEPGFSHKEGLDNYGFRLWQEISNWVPAFELASGIQATTCGYYETSPDHNAIIGYDDKIRNLIHATGFSGHGVMEAPFAGEAVRQLVEKGPSLRELILNIRDREWSLSLNPFSPGRDYSHSEGKVI